MPVRPQGRDWTPLIVLAVAVSVALTGAGFLGGYAVGYAQHKPAADRATARPTARATAPAADASSTPSPLSRPSPLATPTPGPTSTAADRLPQCSFADFPFYPGSEIYHISPPMPNSWYVNQPTLQVASYFARGAYQLTWTFNAGPSATVAPGSSVMSYKFRFSRAPACRGELTIYPETLYGGASYYQMIPDAP
jgi:hypothetical protein